MRTTGSRVVYENPWMRIREDDVVWPDGSTGIYGVVEKPDFAVVLPREHGGFWMVEQYRYPVRRRGWEFPMGTWPPGHAARTDGTDAELLARSELLEETGLSAASMEPLGRLYVANGYSPSGFDVFLATGLTQGQTQRESTEADMVHRFVTDGELSEMIATGEIVDAPSLAALLLWERSAARSVEARSLEARADG
jgi:8-oxo-dGTP pyrophosphatase MutT (NUDIX family)